jgi:hypothetical protein
MPTFSALRYLCGARCLLCVINIYMKRAKGTRNTEGMKRSRGTCNVPSAHCLLLGSIFYCGFQIGFALAVA